MFLEGRIVEFLDSDSLKLGYVRKQEHDKLKLIDARGRNLTVGDDRVIVVHRAAPESEFPALARQISERVLQRQAEVDVELLWQSLGNLETAVQTPDLAALFFAETTPEASSAVFRALFEDTLFFKRKGTQFFPKTHEQVETEVLRRQREREHEEFRKHAAALISELVRKKNAEIPADAAGIIDRIHTWLRLQNRDLVGEILQEIAGATKARDAAYDILLRAGRIDKAADRFLVIGGIEARFPQPVLETTAALAPYAHTAKRVDYREHQAFTIDDEDTSEVDDALTVFRNDNEIVVGIHIADVSAFVGKGDLLDAEAARRSSTIYLPYSSVRMFPERLSTDLASLNAGTDRPGYTIEVRFDANGNRLGYRILLTTIRVARRLSYDEADAAIAEGDDALVTLQRIAADLQGARRDRGAITFRRPELKVRVHGDDIMVKKINPNSPSRVLVSEMMILANGLSADFAALNSLPVIFRTQEPREAVAIDATPVVEALAFERLRRTFKRSRLSLSPGGHSGLGLTAYTQASSPIRRYADLVTQRQFTAMMAGQPVPHGREELLQILASAESTEVEIRQLEERATQYWLLQYLSREHMQDVLNAIIIDAKGNVELEDYYVRAKISGGLRDKPGEAIRVRIDNIDALKGELRLLQV
jgi:exoribonuclease II